MVPLAYEYQEIKTDIQAALVSLSLVVVKGQSRLCLTEQLGVEALEGGGFALAAALDVAVEIFRALCEKILLVP